MIGDVNRPPTADEMRQMEAIVDQAMRDGAIGLSTSLIYLPAMYSTTEEIVDLARVAARYGGVYFTHMRDEGDKIDMGLDEAFRIGREANIPVNIWHLKVGGRANWGRMPHVIERIEQARAEGLDVAANVYPYIASSTALSTLAPDWALEGGYAAFKARLADPAQRARILEEFRKQFEKRGERGIYVSRIANPAYAQYEKHFMPEIAATMGVTQEEALARLFSDSNVSPRVIFFSMDENDVQYALKQPWVSVGADSGSPTAADRAAQQRRSSARLRHVPARRRPLRPRREALPARGGGAQDDVAGGRPCAPRRSRHSPARNEGRHHRLRPEYDSRCGDVRRPPPFFGGGLFRCREWSAGFARWKDDGRLAGAHDPGPWIREKLNFEFRISNEELRGIEIRHSQFIIRNSKFEIHRDCQ